MHEVPDSAKFSMSVHIQTPVLAHFHKFFFHAGVFYVSYAMPMGPCVRTFFSFFPTWTGLFPIADVDSLFSSWRSTPAIFQLGL